MTKSTEYLKHNNYYDRIASLESNFKYNAENQLHYLGKYQMSKLALIDSGYYKKGDGIPGNNYNNSFWTGKDGVYGKDDFLKNAQAQENAMLKYTNTHWKQISDMGLDKYIGKNVDGVVVTKSGMLATSHLLGIGGLRDFLKGNNKSDANGTTAKDYMTKVSNVDTNFSESKFSLLNKNQEKENFSITKNYINSELGDLLSQSSVDQDNPNSSPSENPTTQSENIPQEEVSVDAVKDMLATEDMKQTADFMSEVKLQLPSMMGVMVARLALGEDIELVSADMASRLIATSAINAYAENNWSSSFAS